MNKKTIIKIALLMLVGAVVGMGVTLGLIALEEGLVFGLDAIVNFFNSYNVFMYPLLLIGLFIPSYILYKQGLKVLKACEHADEEALDDLSKKSNQKFNLSLTINGVFMVLNFMLMGTTFNGENKYVFLTLAVFMLNAILSSVIEILVIRSIQKYDNRIEGDPTSFKFHKDFLNSCDEAEKLTIYRSGYKAFQLIKNVTFVFMLISILMNMVFKTGSYTVFMLSTLLLVENLGYSIYAMREEKSTQII